MEDKNSGLIILATDIVAAYVGNNAISIAELPALIRRVHDALADIGRPDEAAPAAQVFKVTPGQIRKSITPDALISFEDGRPYKTLKRHLTTRGLTAEAYKAKWGLPSDYPTTAPAYSEARSAMAKALGLGQGGRKAKGRAKKA